MTENFLVGPEAAPMHVEQYRPARPTHEVPILMLHGGGHTGACYRETPDGRAGWAVHLAQQGWRVLVADWPGYGRSPAPAEFPAMSMRRVVEANLDLLAREGRCVLLVHSMSGAIGWKIAEAAPARVAAMVAIAPAPPANLDFPRELGPPVAEDRAVRYGAETARRFWANSPRFPRHAFDAYVRSLVPESARALNERNDINGMGLRVDAARLAAIPKLILTGDHDPRHPQALDAATAAFVGGRFVWLADLGLSGHGHMMMLEHGHLAIADLIAEWLGAQGL